MLTPQIIEKINQLKMALETHPEFLQNLKSTPNESTENPLLTFAQQQGIDFSQEELRLFEDSLRGQLVELQKLHDLLLAHPQQAEAIATLSTSQDKMAALTHLAAQQDVTLHWSLIKPQNTELDDASLDQISGGDLLAGMIDASLPTLLNIIKGTQHLTFPSIPTIPKFDFSKLITPIKS